MAALAVRLCPAASRLLDTLRASGWVSKARRALAQKLNVIIWCEGAALAIGTWVFLFRCLGTLAQRSGLLKALSLSRSKLLGRRLASCLLLALAYWQRKDMTKQYF